MCWELCHVIKTQQAWLGVQKVPKTIYTRRMDAKIQPEKREGEKCETEIIFQVPVFQRQQDNCLPELGSLFLKGYLPTGHRSQITGRMLILVFAGVLVPDSSDQSSHQGLNLLQTVLGTVSNYYIKLAQILPCYVFMFFRIKSSSESAERKGWLGYQGG